MKRDDLIFEIIEKEHQRQLKGIELIASENFVSDQVMQAMGSCLTNKYAEGYPGKRYYGGCEVVDQSETIAIERIKKLFGAEWANVQPHSGAQANAAVFLACLNPGDKFLGLNLAHGGHLSHGSAVNTSGIIYSPCEYNVSRETGRVDYDQMEEVALRERPKLIIGGGSAYSREWDYKRMRAIADEVGALLMIDMAHPAGLIAAGVWLYKNWDTVKAKASELGAYLGAKWGEIKTTVSAYATQLGDFVNNVWTKIKDGAVSLGTGIKDALVKAFSSIAGIIKAPINAAISLINGAISGINGIGFTIPDWIPGIGGKAFSVNVPTIPMLAKGGFTTGPSIAGEAGQEAVISFDPAYRKQNIGYLAKAASMLGLRTADEGSLGYYAQRIDSLSNGESLAATNNSNTTINLGGVTFAPTVTVAGSTEKRENIIEQLRNYQGDLLDLIEDLLATKEAASYGASGVF